MYIHCLSQKYDINDIEKLDEVLKIAVHEK